MVGNNIELHRVANSVSRQQEIEMDELIAELEKASEGSRELSDQVLLACGWTSKGRPGTWHRPDGSFHPCGRYQSRLPDPTCNVQDTIDWVVPENHMWSLQYDPSDDETVCECLLDEWVGGPETGGSYRPGPEIILKGNRPALTLVTAALKARRATLSPAHR